MLNYKYYLAHIISPRCINFSFSELINITFLNSNMNTPKFIHKIITPISLGVIVFGLLLMLTQYLTYQRYLINKETKRTASIREINAVKYRLQNALSYSLSATKTLAYVVETKGVPKNFETIAKDILGSNKYIDAIELIDHGTITHIYPLKGNENAIGYDILKDSLRNKEAIKAIKSKSLFFAGPLELKQGGKAIVGRLPLFHDNKFIGFSAVVIELSTLLNAAGIDTLSDNNFIYQISKKNINTNKEEYFIPQPLPFSMEDAISVDVPEGEWKLYVALKHNKGNFNIIIISIFGFFLSLLGGILTRQLLQEPEKLNNLIRIKTSQLAASEQYYRSLIENSGDAIVLLDKNGNVIYQTNSAERISGYSIEEMKNLETKDIIHPDDLSDDLTTFENLAKSPGSVIKRNHRFKHKNGHYIWIEGTYTNLLNDENVRAIIYNYFDVTELVKAEERARKSERLYELISKINQVMVYAKDEQTLYSEACRIAVELGNFRLAWVGIIGNNGTTVTPLMFAGEERNYLSKVLSPMLKDISLSNGPTSVAFRTGNYVLCNDIANDSMMKEWSNEAINRGYYSSIALPIKKFGKTTGSFNLYASTPNFFDNNEINSLLEATADISFMLENFEKEKMRIQAEKEVLKVFREKETTLNRINDSMVSVDNEWRYTFLNDSAVSTHANGKEKTIGQLLWDEHPEMKGTIFWDKYHEAMESKKVVEFESYYPTLDTWFYVKVYPSSDGLTIFYNDISRRKRAEEQVASEKIFSDSIVNSLPGVFYLYNREGKFIRWNHNFEIVSGYCSEEIQNMKPLDFFEGMDKEMVRQKIDTVFERGNAEISAHFYTKGKRRIPYYFNGRKVIFNEIEYLIGMGIDISDRVAAEIELLERNVEIQRLTAHLGDIQEEERTRIAREIHDELGQQLTGIKMDTAWLDKKLINQDQQVQTKIKTMLLLIDETIETIRRIASELRPGILDDLGLMAAIEWYGEEFEKRTGIKLNFMSNMNDFNPTKTISTNVYRLYQEALTNIARHANATLIETTLNETNSEYILTIKDNGDGFDLNEIKSRRTLGITGMRERTILLEGTLNIDSQKTKGTIISLFIPKTI